MSEIKHPPGPYMRVDSTVYALQHAGWRKGEEQFCNRIYANVQRGPGCSAEEAEAVATLFQAAPDLLEALRWYVENDDTNIGMEGNEFWEEGLERGKSAIAKAEGKS